MVFEIVFQMVFVPNICTVREHQQKTCHEYGASTKSFCHA